MNIRDSIKRILRENSEDRFKNSVREFIDELGLYQTKKYLGLSYTQMVKLSEIEINSEIANVLIIENLGNGNFKKTYKEFTLTPTMDGVIYWDGELKTGEFIDNYTEVITAMETPFWDGMDFTPIEIDWFSLLDKSRKIDKQVVAEFSGDGNYYETLKDKTSFDSVEELFNWYYEFYLPNVYDIIMTQLLPKAQQDMQDRLDDYMIF